MTREERIRRSLDALNAPCPTELSLAEWKRIIEEEEEDDESRDGTGDRTAVGAH